MLPIAQAMARIQQIQQGLEITTIWEVEEGAAIERDFPLAVARAHQYRPPANEPPSEFPCWINEWTSPTVDLKSGLLTGDFEIHMQLLIDDADADRAAAIATAFYESLLFALTQNVKLGAWGPATVRRLRGADPTLAGLQYPNDRGPIYVGLDLILDLYLNKSATMRP